MEFLIVYGVGGCWSGYTGACIIEVESIEEANDKAFDIAYEKTKKKRGSLRGFSYDVEHLEDGIKSSVLFKTRLLPEARALIRSTSKTEGKE